MADKKKKKIKRKRITANAIFIQNDKALLVQRHYTKKYYAGMWDVPGGHLKKNETPEAALLREVAEEIGVEVKAFRHLVTFDELDFTSGEPFRHHVYVVTEWEGEPVNRAEKEHAALGWFTASEIATMEVTPSTRTEVTQLLSDVVVSGQWSVVSGQKSDVMASGIVTRTKGEITVESFALNNLLSPIPYPPSSILYPPDCKLCGWKIGLAYETDYWQIVVNRNQNYLGKTFVVLKRHIENPWDMTAEEWAELRFLAEKLRGALVRLFQPDHFNYAFLQNQDPHVHLHVIPRYADDRIFQGETFTDGQLGQHYALTTHSVSKEVFQALTEALRKELQ